MSKIKQFKGLVNEAGIMPIRAQLKKHQEGKIGYILLWLLGIPIPILFLIFLLRGCD